MTRPHRFMSVVGALLAVAVAVAAASAAPQEPKPDPNAKPAPEAKPAPQPGGTSREALGPLVPLDVQVVINRYQGEKRVSSHPYSLAVNANDRSLSSVRMGAQVPIVGSSPGPNFPEQVNYQNVGTNIDCVARTMDDGRFQVNITVEDSSVYQNIEGAVAPSAAGRPVIRSFRSLNTLVLRDGQTRQFSAATDRVNGEVVRIEVTLRVVK
ncbi:MAG TPA: hypothetical protein VIY56_01445 [Vicinamibacterales bacterium]